jgi:shikimate kinase
LIIGLIGMSGAGKSSWASRLAGAGYDWIHCDDLIANNLRASFDIGAGSVHDLGSWMGFPYEARYAAREAIYLQHETAVLRQIAARLAQRDDPAARVIVDLTGSAVYVDQAVLAGVRRLMTVVYLAVSPRLHEQLMRDYLANPRPLLWAGSYQPLPGEPPAAALVRCYPQLLAARERLYEQISDVTLADELHRSPAFDVAAFLDTVDRARRQRSSR